MSFWQRFLRWVRPRLVVVRGPEMSEHEMNKALASLPDSHPVWRTINQLIDTAERNAWDDAAARIEQPTLMAGYVGGSKHLDLLRGDLVKRREMGMNLEARKPGNL